jgi:hypothetical protein
MRKLSFLSAALSLFVPLLLVPALAFAQAAPSAAPAAPSAAATSEVPPSGEPAPSETTPNAGGMPAAETKKHHGGGPSLGLDPSVPQAGKVLVSPTDVVEAPDETASSEWKFDVSGYFRAPLRMSWGPPHTTDPSANPGVSPGTQFRTPPLVPDWNYIDWRYTNSMVGPWTQLDFHYGNSRVKATVQIASYNLSDAGYRRLEANLGINQAYLSISYPELFDDNSRFTLTVGGFTNRYGAAGRYDGGKYETYLFGRTHIAGGTGTFEYDINDTMTVSVEGGFGAKLEPIPFLAAPTNPNQNLAFNPYPGPVAQESTFVAHIHAGLSIKKAWLIGLHYIDTFANDNERAGGYKGGPNTPDLPFGGRSSNITAPHIKVGGLEVKLLGGVLGDGYIGYAHLDALNAEYLGDAIESIHSFGGWQLHDNYFGPAGVYGPSSPTSGKIDTVLFQHVFSFGQLFRYPQAFWGDGPDLIASVFAMWNKVSGATISNYNHSRLKAGAELTYLPLSWLGVGARYDVVDPNLDDSTQNFSVFSPRVILRSAFVTHEQILIQYSRYFYGANAAVSQFPYNGGGSDYPHNSAGQAVGADSNAFTMAAIIWF